MLVNKTRPIKICYLKRGLFVENYIWLSFSFQRGTPSNETGPHTAMEGFYYIYTEANGYSEGDRGILSLKNLNLSKYTLWW